MRLIGGVYEGPASHGILRLAAGIRGVHAVLRAGPGEGYFPALYAGRERDGRPAPVTLSPLQEGRRESYAPGDLSRDLSGVARRHPGVEAVILARSESALLSGEAVPDAPLPEVGGHEPALITCAWQTPGMGETEAAELALEDLVRAHVRTGLERTQYPTVNLFGPPVFGPGAAAEYDEAERLLNLVGVEVNARVPLGATVEDLRRLPRAWANVLLYREVGESATLFLQDEHGVGRVTTPMIGAAGTGAALRAVGELCELDPRFVERTVWSELSHTSKLPWYARLGRPETFVGRRTTVFGDFTYPLGLGYALAREVGLEVVACGTYLTHLQLDFLFHAQTFTADGFVEDDPQEVANRIEAARPDLIVGTELEAPVAQALGVPFLPLCYPAGDRPFVERPLMGYGGSSILADRLDGALG
ncbi:MAG: Light-independent protochlorophyllide reductase subunit B [uncultured Rubrobacteraceae bacterium]|jgi:light-independent protochlorophyllide reductase subunit B|uniref:Light-independent protochlorophyllide reductase subunit B n=1 Tax=uncultured Rubrobacteraceae bacterium TaxID=349277 RepID=A0A6J4Q196_9ACTN|nr:MAG: Light-independent protochlorophyllide reductase subunit B [uncultured Rubrobacteraceae bacterium]